MLNNPIALFSVYQHRQLMALSIPVAVAWKLKKRNPSLVIKFQRMEIGA